LGVWDSDEVTVGSGFGLGFVTVLYDLGFL
jgi:hypothetical protein